MIQSSIRPYTSEEKKIACEATPVRFLIGNTENVKSVITSVIERGAVVLTRSWVNAFAYIRDVEDAQVKILTAIYNSYYNSPVDIRAEITEMNNVTWVRAFNCIFKLHAVYTCGSFIDALDAFKLYTGIDRKKLNHSAFQQITGIIRDTFEGLADDSLTVDVIKNFNQTLGGGKYRDLRRSLLGESFHIPVFDEYDLTYNKSLTSNLSALTWATSFKLFTEVFSPESRYMTVHQAKGLEWENVIVSAIPGKHDKITIEEVYSKPEIMEEMTSNEFVRMYYVACSRAKEGLYIHLPAQFDQDLIKTALKNRCIHYEIIT